MADSTVTVNVKPATESKINWTQIAGIVASVAAYFGLNLDANQLVEVILGIQAAVAVLTVIFKTFFTKTITPVSAAKV